MDIHTSQARIKAKLEAAVSAKLGCRAVWLGQRTKSGAWVPDGIADGSAQSVFAVPAHYVPMGIASGLLVEPMKGTR